MGCSPAFWFYLSFSTKNCLIDFEAQIEIIHQAEMTFINFLFGLATMRIELKSGIYIYIHTYVCTPYTTFPQFGAYLSHTILFANKSANNLRIQQQKIKI